MDAGGVVDVTVPEVTSQEAETFNDYENAGWFSRVFMRHVPLLIRRVRTQETIDATDLDVTVGADKGESVDEIVKKHKPTQDVVTPFARFKQLFAAGRTQYMRSIGAVTAASVGRVARCYCLLFFVRALKAGFFVKATLWCAALVALMLTVIVVHHHAYLQADSCAVRVRNALNAAVFDKSLRLHLIGLSEMASGEVLALLTNDAQQVMELLREPGIFVAPIQLALCLTCIYFHGGGTVPTIAILCTTLVFVAVQVWLARGTGRLRKRSVKYTDARLQSISEIVVGSDVVKMYAWQEPLTEQVSEIRKHEHRLILRSALLKFTFYGLYMGFGTLIAFVGAASLLWYAPADFSSSAVVFQLSLIAVFLWDVGVNVALCTQNWSECKVTFRRLNTFLDLPECHGEVQPVAPTSLEMSALPDTANVETTAIQPSISSEDNDDVVLLNNASFSWHGMHENEEKKAHLCDLNLRLANGSATLITGPTGSGKSSLLLALLGEMPCVGGSWRSHPSVSYASQIPWLFAGSVLQNILFGEPLDRERLAQVIDACALRHDLTMLPDGINQWIGERGAGLSGGQRARVSLARAVYRRAELYLLDAPLAAVDAKVAHQISTRCFGPKGLLKDATRVVVSHHYGYASNFDHVVVMNTGRIEKCAPPVRIDFAQLIALTPTLSMKSPSVLFSQASVNGPPSLALDALEAISLHSSAMQVTTPRASLPRLRSDVAGLSLVSRRDSTVSLLEDAADMSVAARLHVDESMPHVILHTEMPDEDSEVRVKRLISGLSKSDLDAEPEVEAEDSGVGGVGLESVVALIKSGGGWTLFGLLMLLVCIKQAATLAATHLLSLAAALPHTVETAQWTAFVVTGAAAFVLGVVWNWGMCYFLLSAANSLFSRMLLGVVSSPMQFFQRTPAGRILNRFGTDQFIADILFPTVATDAMSLLTWMILLFLYMCVLTNGIAVVPIVLVLIGVYRVRNDFTITSTSVKRLEATTRSPLYSLFTALLDGVVTVRACRQQERLQHKLWELLDRNTAPWLAFVRLSRWFGLTVDLMTATVIAFSGFLGVLLVYLTWQTPEVAALSIIYGCELLGVVQYTFRRLAETENLMTSVERMSEFTSLPSESSRRVVNATVDAEAQESEWPNAGQITLKDAVVYYDENADSEEDSGVPIIKGITLTIKPGEWVGCCGRTGAGKSTLFNCLLRLLETSRGSVSIDGVDISQLDLRTLRRAVSVIPQQPFLFGGSLRKNLDPFDTIEDDDELWRALSIVRLDCKVRDNGGLDMLVREGGSNFSVGERQLVCVARALLRPSKILLCDEMTANVDGKTDALVQRVLRKHFSDRTVVTVAHRLDTIADYAKVLVLDDGRVAEFDKPKRLLRNPDSLYAQLWRQHENQVCFCGA
ncbi:MAG: hypothetical protein MHM6MM_000489 [Cercozoa sp. M6MM]